MTTQKRDGWRAYRHDLTPRVLKRFWAKVRKSDGCWEWTASTFRTGYGAFGIGRSMVYAHRVSYEIHFETPGGLFVCHRCDNRKCVRPDHLFLGTAKDNHDDMTSKGRQVIGRRARGSAHPMAVLTDDQVRTIRVLLKAGEPLATIARRFGLKSYQTVSNIRDGRQWSSVQ